MSPRLRRRQRPNPANSGRQRDKSCADLPSRVYLEHPAVKMLDLSTQPQPTWQYWRVVAKGGRAPHLLPLVLGQGAGTVALCGARIFENKRDGTATSVKIPRGDECAKCQLVAGWYSKQMLSIEQKQEIGRLAAWEKVVKILGNLGLTQAQKEKGIDQIIRA
jgi:hypothetical protein